MVKAVRTAAKAPLVLRGEELQIDFRAAERPARSYAATWLAVRTRGDRIDLVFGQHTPMGTRIDNLLVIEMGRVHFHTAFVASVGDGFRELALKYLVATPDNLLQPTEDARWVREVAIAAPLSMNEIEAEIDFFDIPPTDVQRRDPTLRPIVTVRLSTSLIADLLTQASRL
jgi:hypothetical protein